MKHQHKSAACRFWEGVDWTRRDDDLAAEYGYTTRNAWHWRRRLGMPKQPPMWLAGADWTQPFKAVAAKAGVAYQRVRYWAGKLGKQRPVAEKLVRFKGVDWTKQDIIIATELGCSRERVRQVRKALGLPKSPNNGKCDSPIKDWMLAHMADSGTMTAAEVAAELGIREGHARDAARNYGFKLAPAATVRPWELFDWRLPNSVLKDIWHMKDPPSNGHGHIVAIKRWALNVELPHWRMKPVAIAVVIDFQRAVRAQQKVAARWFAEQADKLSTAGKP